MTITPTQLDFFFYNLQKDCVKNVKDHTKQELDKSNARIMSAVRETEGMIKARHTKPPLSDTNIIVRIIQFLSHGTLAIVCRVGRVWNTAICASPVWLRVFRIEYPLKTYVTSSTHPKYAKVFFSQAKTIEKLSTDLDVARKDQDDAMMALTISRGMCVVAVTPPWVYVAALIIDILPDPIPDENYPYVDVL